MKGRKVLFQWTHVVWSDWQTTYSWDRYRSQSLSHFLACLCPRSECSWSSPLGNLFRVGMLLCLYVRQIRLESRLSPPPAQAAHPAQADPPVQVAPLALLQLTDSSSSSGTSSGSAAPPAHRQLFQLRHLLWLRQLLWLTGNSSGSGYSAGSGCFSRLYSGLWSVHAFNIATHSIILLYGQWLGNDSYQPLPQLLHAW